ncbi:MAG TPA: preprotein translocase subunit YajC [Chitinophagaceae bacterium]|jgi:preprotein translocase subunit YajC|nr:preprotein translocase subunit YajC [Chitinophagaceae bacterium]
MKAIFATAASFVLLLSSCAPQSADGKSSGGMAGNIQFIFLGLMILVFWMFFIRPQAKRAKNQKKFIEDLQKGTKIVTIAGIHGTINKVNEDGTLNIEVSPGSYLKIEKSAISMDWTAALNKPDPGDKK